MMPPKGLFSPFGGFLFNSASTNCARSYKGIEVINNWKGGHEED